MFVCVCTETTEKDLEKKYQEYMKINPSSASSDIKDFKKYANVCQQCCKCNPAIRHCWNAFKRNNS